MELFINFMESKRRKDCQSQKFRKINKIGVAS